MKKFFRFLIVSLVIFIVAGTIGAVIFIKTIDLNRYKQQITDAAGKTLQRTVDFDDISFKVSLSKGINLLLTGLVISDDPAFSADDFLSAREIDLGVSLHDLILRREIRILDVSARGLLVTVIKESGGRMNIETLAQSGQGTGPQQPVDSPQKSGAGMAGLPAIFITQLSLKDARVQYVDRSFSPEMRIHLDKINFQASDISLRDEFRFRLQAAYLSRESNIDVEGNARIYLSDGSFELTNTDVTLALSSFSMVELKDSLPMLKDASLPKTMKGTARFGITRLRVGAQGLSAFNARGALSQGKMELEELASPIDDIEVSLALNESEVVIEKGSCSVGGGRVDLSGAVDSYLTEQIFKIKLNLNDVRLSELLEQSGSSLKVAGMVSGETELNGRGFSSSAFLDNLAGSSTIALKDGRLTDINILKLVMDNISFIPNLGLLLEGGLPEEWKDKIRKKDTVITSLELSADIKNRLIEIKPLRTQADSFIFQGDGTVGFDRTFTFDGQFTVPKELSDRMMRAVKEMEYLQDAQGLVSFPLKIFGSGSSVSVKPDVKSIGMRAVEQKGQHELQKVLDKVLNRDDTQEDSGPPAEDGQPEAEPPADGTQQTEEKTIEEQLIGTVLDTIFK